VKYINIRLQLVFIKQADSAACRRAAAAVGGSTEASTAAVGQVWLGQRRTYRQLLNQNCAEFWSAKFSSSSNPRDMWSTVDQLLGRGHHAQSWAVM